jgi:hypothetical protein
MFEKIIIVAIAGGACLFCYWRGTIAGKLKTLKMIEIVLEKGMQDQLKFYQEIKYINSEMIKKGEHGVVFYNDKENKPCGKQ